MLSRAKFQLKASVHLTFVSMMIWLVLSVCGIGVFGWSWFALAYIVLAASVIGRWVWRYAWLKSSTSLVAISWTPDELCCYLKNGSQVSGHILAKSAFNPYFTTLHIMTVEGRQFWWPLMIDSGPADGLRKLRVFGRWNHQHATANRN
jgi:predicted neutral ceramidase superfamily lipid hydrolase